MASSLIKLGILDLRIGRPVAGGAMIARHEGRIVLVDGGIPGERVRARVSRAQRDVIFASVTEVLEPDADRRQVGGDQSCGGHSYAHIAYDRQRELKSELIADGLNRLGRLAWTTPIPVMPSPERGYRMRARLHVRGGRVGFLKEGTHRVCDAAQTRQLLPETESVLGEIAQCLLAARLRHSIKIELAENLTGNERVLHVMLGRRDDTSHIAGLGRCSGVTGLTASRPGGQIQTVAGVPTVGDPLALMTPVSGTQSVTRRAASFFQANRFLLPRLVSQVCQRVRLGPVLDLYTGVGLFATALAAQGIGPITAVEGDTVAAEDLSTNARAFGQRLQPVHASVEEFLAGIPRPSAETVIVDPPRSGMSRTAIERLAAAQPGRLIYVGCDVATLARDVGKFSRAGYAVRHLEAFDFFPNTPHVEILATLDLTNAARQ
jgi:23S rRNA (uracil1939-C5)-methyltransferase